MWLRSWVSYCYYTHTHTHTPHPGSDTHDAGTVPVFNCCARYLVRIEHILGREADPV